MEYRTWGASTLDQYTVHVLKLKVPTPPVAEWVSYQADICILEKSANLKVPTAREAALSEEVAPLKRQVTLQQQRLERTTAERKASREEPNHLLPDVDLLEGVTPLERMPGVWVEEPVSRKSGTPPRVQEMYVTMADL